MRKPKEPTCRDTNLLLRFDKLNLEFFGGLVCGGIGWRRFPISSDKIVTQACCVFEERLIKVNYLMDDTRIPLWYLDFVIYHEMLHLQHGPQQFSPDGYGHPHSLRFQCMEASHPDYHRAVEFEEKHLPRVINSWVAWKKWTKKSTKPTPSKPAAKKK